MLEHVATIFFNLFADIIRKGNVAMRIALGFRNWDLPTTH